MATKKTTEKKNPMALTKKEKAELEKAGKAAQAEAKKKGMTFDQYIETLPKR